MATLDELLALLPDNDSGEISAADMRAVVTGLWDQGAALEARVTALETDPDDGGGTTVSVSSRYQINPQSGATPSGMQVTASSGEWGLATWLRFATVDQNNVDQTAVLMVASAIFAQEQSDSSNWTRWSVTDTPTQHGSYVEVPVELVNSAGSIAAAGWQAAEFLFTVPVA